MDEISWVSVLLGIIATIGAAILTYIGVKTKDSTEQTAVALQAWKDLVDPLRETIADGDQKISTLESIIDRQQEQMQAERRDYQRRIDSLVAQVRSLAARVEQLDHYGEKHS